MVHCHIDLTRLANFVQHDYMLFTLSCAFYENNVLQCDCDGAKTDLPALVRGNRQANSAVLEDALGAIMNHFKKQGVAIPGKTY